LNHVGDFNNASIGIEFINHSWLSGAELQHPDRYPEGNDYLHTFWGDFLNIYRIPPSIDQLEKLVALVKFFIIDTPAAIAGFKAGGASREAAAITFSQWFSILPEDVAESVIDELIVIERNWLQLISYRDIPASWRIVDFDGELADELEKDERNLFIVTKAFNLFEPAQMKNKKGIFGHGAFVTGSKHIDGCYIVLYAWLRLEKNYNPADAYHIAKVLMKKHAVRFRDRNHGGSLVAALDVRNATLAQALTEVYP
jgi:hypothetical protein